MTGLYTYLFKVLVASGILFTLVVVLQLVPHNLELTVKYYKSNTSMTSHKLRTPMEDGMCIEPNICKDAIRSDIYYYRRNSMFNESLSAPVNYNASIKHTESIVPRKVHFVLFSNNKGKNQFKFHYMIAILAANRYVRPDKIYFWHDKPPVGKYWDETKQRVKNLYLVRIDRPTEIFGNPVKVVEHASDIARLEILLEYGGMYFDTDSIVVNPVDPLLKFDITMGRSLPKALANGIMFSKPWSDFHKIWYKRYETFDDKKWGHHSVIMAYKLSKQYPSLIHIEPTSLCRPNAVEQNWIFGTDIHPWKENNYVVHLYMRYSKGRGKSLEDIQNWNTTAGQIMRHIYYNQGVLKEQN